MEKLSYPSGIPPSNFFISDDCVLYFFLAEVQKKKKTRNSTAVSVNKQINHELIWNLKTQIHIFFFIYLFFRRSTWKFTNENAERIVYTFNNIKHRSEQIYTETRNPMNFPSLHDYSIQYFSDRSHRSLSF